MLAQTALLKAIKYCGSKQKRLADLIGEDADKISYWLNRAKQIPFHQAIAIETVTEGLVSRYDLAPYARIKNRESSPKAHTFTTIKISERVKLGVAFEKQIGNRQGQRNDMKSVLLPGRKCVQVKGKTGQLAAQEAGFKSKDTYLRAKKVVERGNSLLIDAMDNQSISIANAAIIANFPREEQENLLNKTKQKRLKMRFDKEKTGLQKKPKNNLNHVMNQIMQDDDFIKTEMEHQLPLRLPLIGLINFAGESLKFIWEPDYLKYQLLPYIAIDFNQILQILEDKRWIKKTQQDDLIFGQIIIK